jgi:hypothetical protein
MNVQEEQLLNYIGMQLDFSVEREFQITMPGYTDDILKSCSDVPLRPAFTPASIDLFTTYEEKYAKLNVEDAKKYHSLVMKLMYLAKPLGTCQLEFSLRKCKTRENYGV